MAEREIHSSHMPEPDDRRLISGLTYCRRCCRLLDSDKRGVTTSGAAECPGPARLRPFEEMRERSH